MWRPRRKPVAPRQGHHKEARKEGSDDDDDVTAVHRSDDGEGDADQDRHRDSVSTQQERSDDCVVRYRAQHIR